MRFCDIKTKNGYPADEVISALQKSIRRGKELDSCYWANELYESDYVDSETGEKKDFIDKCWQRLLVISVEDIGPAVPDAAVITYSNCIEYYKRFEKEAKTTFCGQHVDPEILSPAKNLFGPCIDPIQAASPDLRRELIIGTAYALAHFPKDRTIDEIYTLTKNALKKKSGKMNLCSEINIESLLKQFIKNKHHQSSQISEFDVSEFDVSEFDAYEGALNIMLNHEERFWPWIDKMVRELKAKTQTADVAFANKKKIDRAQQHKLIQKFFSTLEKTYEIMPKGRGDRYMRGLFAVYALKHDELFAPSIVIVPLHLKEMPDFISENMLEVPDYAIDKHTARGRAMGRGDLHFWQEGAKLEYVSSRRSPLYYEIIIQSLTKNSS